MDRLYSAEFMARMAIAAKQGGAAAIRANTPVDIRAIRAAVWLPIIGLYKVGLPGYDIYIMPRVEDACAVAEAGADIIAVDATARPRPGYDSLAAFIVAIHTATGLLVLAEISTYAEAIAAESAGADRVDDDVRLYALPRAARRPGHRPGGGVEYDAHRSAAGGGSLSHARTGEAALKAGAISVVVGGAITSLQSPNLNEGEYLVQTCCSHPSA